MHKVGLSFSFFLTLLASFEVGLSLTFLKTAFTSEKQRLAEQEFLLSVTNSTQSLLRMPAILDPFTTARQHVDTEQRGQSDRVIVGILVENYSKYRLTDPRTSKKTCTANREINLPLAVDAGTAELFAVDNQAFKHRGVCGTFSWQISQSDGSPVLSSTGDPHLGRRLVVTFYVPFSGACGPEGRFNSFSLNVWHAHLNSSQAWTKPELVESFFSIDHESGATSAFINDGRQALVLFDDGRFLLSGSMERGCKPMFTIQFLPGSRNKPMLWNHQGNKVEKLVDEKGIDLAKETNSTGSIFSETSVTLLSMLLCLSLLVLIVVLLLARRACHKRLTPAFRD